MQNTHFLHIPKTGGTALEHTMILPHVHMLHSTNSSLLVIARDPVDRLASAYHFCRERPWDSVLIKRNLTCKIHCCCSSVTRTLTFVEWITKFVGGSTCLLPNMNLSYIAPFSFWTHDSTIKFLLRHRCLEYDLKRVLKNDTLKFKRVNMSPNSRSHPCEQRGFEAAPQSAWKLFSREYKSDFYSVYNRTFNSLEEWQKSCWAEHTQSCKTSTSSSRYSDIRVHGLGRLQVFAQRYRFH